MVGGLISIPNEIGVLVAIKALILNIFGTSSSVPGRTALVET